MRWFAHDCNHHKEECKQQWCQQLGGACAYATVHVHVVAITKCELFFGFRGQSKTVWWWMQCPPCWQGPTGRHVDNWTLRVAPVICDCIPTLLWAIHLLCSCKAKRLLVLGIECPFHLCLSEWWVVHGPGSCCRFLLVETRQAKAVIQSFSASGTGLHCLSGCEFGWQQLSGFPRNEELLTVLPSMEVIELIWCALRCGLTELTSLSSLSVCVVVVVRMGSMMAISLFLSGRGVQLVLVCVCTWICIKWCFRMWMRCPPTCGKARFDCTRIGLAVPAWHCASIHSKHFFRSANLCTEMMCFLDLCLWLMDWTCCFCNCRHPFAVSTMLLNSGSCEPWKACQPTLFHCLEKRANWWCAWVHMAVFHWCWH